MTGRCLHSVTAISSAICTSAGCCLESEVNACARHAGGCCRKRAAASRKPVACPSSPSRLSHRGHLKSSAPQIQQLFFRNSSLNKLQSKLTNRHPRACHHTQLWEKVPGHPYHVRIAERRRHRSTLRLTLCATSIPPWSRPATCTLVWKLFVSVLLVESPVRQGCLERGDEDTSLHFRPRGSCWRAAEGREEASR